MKLLLEMHIFFQVGRWSGSQVYVVFALVDRLFLLDPLLGSPKYI